MVGYGDVVGRRFRSFLGYTRYGISFLREEMKI